MLTCVECNAQEISDATGVPVYRVRLMLKEAGVDLVPARRSAKDRHWGRILELHSQGLTNEEISAEIDAPLNTLRRWMRQERLTPNNQRARQLRDFQLPELRQGGHPVPEVR